MDRGRLIQNRRTSIEKKHMVPSRLFAYLLTRGGDRNGSILYGLYFTKRTVYL